MKIDDVVILNWKTPGDKWWDGVESRPDEPLIEARMDLTLTFREYQELLARDNRECGGVLPPGGTWQAVTEVSLMPERNSVWSRIKRTFWGAIENA